ncbi:hypothetical protein CHS0354_018808 [Potamilus streckersoni]|uniref:MAM domain-containing protein n=1 Tax=Potamilus streckersoni TaxID=2493646 RepID=A0AAE0TCB4_9BIVA|nr:hypothetical protein CHS0354_018808 [Potamilus streckersoni]
MILFWPGKSFTLLILLFRTILADSKCSLQDGVCTYNINLHQGKTNCETNYNTFSIGDSIKLNDRDKSSQMEQEFHDIKEDHEKRIKELETSIQRVLRSALSSGNMDSNTLELQQAPQHIPPAAPVHVNKSLVNTNEGSLIAQLQGEFTKLKASLKSRTKELLDTKTTLNATLENLKDTQTSLFESSEKLIDAENKVETLEYQASIVKNQLKDKAERLEIASEKLNASETKRLATEEQLYNLVRSEANLKEELGYYKYKLNQTLNELEELRKNYTDLTNMHQKVKRNLRTCELELMDCYTAKTDTFCTFQDSGICGYRQENVTDAFDWEWHKGPTPSSSTGPDGDHTCQNNRGHYMYIEASGKSKGQNALLYSPRYRGLTNQCIEFYYHMYGRHVGTLTVYKLASGSTDLESVWRVYGNQGNVWILARMSVPEHLAKIGYQLVFEGVVENGYEGDISIDDINVRDGDCPASVAVKAVQISLGNSSNSTVISQIERYRSLLRRRHRHERRKLKETEQSSERT